MKMPKLIIFSILWLFSLKGFADPVTIYPIVFCNTLDKKIGKSCLNDKERFSTELAAIQAAIGCDDVDWSNIYTGDQCSKENLDAVISELECTNNDVIFFYYSGHGVRSSKTSDSEWLPQMCLKYEYYDEDKFASAKKVLDRLKAKNPRLIIFITDCCNNKAEWVSQKSLIEEADDIDTQTMDVAALRKLFYDSKGTVVATSSKVGQPSIGFDRGGLFSLAFWSEMYKIEQKQAGSDISWDTLLDATIKRTLRDSQNKQTPLKDVNVVSSHITPPFNEPIPVVDTNNDKELKNSLMTLLDKSISPLKREDKIQGIINKFFNPGATVTVLRRNGTVNFRPKAAYDYLDELALSKSVKGLIIKDCETKNGKYSNINLIEIRND